MKYFEDELREYLSLLKSLIENGNEKFAIELGQMIKARLKSIDTDDDTFPEYEINVIETSVLSTFLYLTKLWSLGT